MSICHRTSDSAPDSCCWRSRCRYRACSTIATWPPPSAPSTHGCKFMIAPTVGVPDTCQPYWMGIGCPLPGHGIVVPGSMRAMHFKIALIRPTTCMSHTGDRNIKSITLMMNKQGGYYFWLIRARLWLRTGSRTRTDCTLPVCILPWSMYMTLGSRYDYQMPAIAGLTPCSLPIPPNVSPSTTIYIKIYPLAHSDCP